VGIHGIVIWTKMLDADTLDQAVMAAQSLQNPQIQHCYDPNQRAGSAAAYVLGEPGKVGWDLYLFYNAGLRWTDPFPVPDDWAHQLKPSNWADPKRYFTGARLSNELGRMMRSIQAG
jgi:hypothetical protein